MTFPDKMNDFLRLISLHTTPNKPIAGAYVYNRSMLHCKI